MNRLRITLKKSTIGYPKDQKDTARALGLRRLNATVIRPDNPAIRGMVRKLHHLVEVEVLPGEEAEAGSAGAREGGQGER